MILDGKRILVTGGTGSFGQAFVKRLLTGEMGKPESITVFSRDEAKQHYMRVSYINRDVATDEVIYRNFQQMLRFRIGDIRDYGSVLEALRHTDVVIHAAALKQVPTCEYFPAQAIATNIEGANNLVRAIRSKETNIETLVALSTDKACGPINVYGMTKAIMERIIVEGNMGTDTRMVCVRYGNVVGSRGSVVPLFLNQIAKGGPITITSEEMTRFLLELERAVDTVFAALQTAQPGELYVPQIPAHTIVDLAHALIDGRDIDIEIIGIRPGEKLHELMISEAESFRTTERDGYYVVRPLLPELLEDTLEQPAIDGEYSSEDTTMGVEELKTILAPYISKHAEGVLA